MNPCAPKHDGCRGVERNNKKSCPSLLLVLAAASLCRGFQAAFPCRLHLQRTLEALLGKTGGFASPGLVHPRPASAQPSRTACGKGLKQAERKPDSVSAAAVPALLLPRCHPRSPPARCNTHRGQPAPAEALPRPGSRSADLRRAAVSGEAAGDDAFPSLGRARDVSSKTRSARRALARRGVGRKGCCSCGKPGDGGGSGRNNKNGSKGLRSVKPAMLRELPALCRWWRRGGRYLRLAAGREPWGRRPNHRPISRDRGDGLVGWAEPVIPPPPPTPRQLPMGRLTGRSGGVLSRCVSKRAFVPETRASPAVSHAATQDVATMQKYFPLHLFFFFFFKLA